MATRAGATGANPEAAQAGWCHWHRGPSGTAQLIRTVPRTSGGDSAANSLFACAPCREQRGLVAAAGERVAS
ncbi:hypothetical protein [Streptomyces sp. SYSU K21746]